MEDQINLEYQTLLPSDVLALRKVSVAPIYSVIKSTITRDFTTPSTLAQLQEHNVQKQVIKPIVKYLKNLNSKATIFACLLNYWDFLRCAEKDLGLSNLFQTRALVCELIAIDLGYNRYPQSNSNEGEGNGREALENLSLEEEVNDSPFELQHDRAYRNSALGIACRSGAKNFCATPLVQVVVDKIWYGDIVFYAKQIDSDQYYHAYECNLPSEARDMLRVRVGFHTKLPDRFGGIFRASRIRVPVYQNFLNIFFFCLLLCIYTLVLNENSEVLTSKEILLLIFIVGYTLDEFRQLLDGGLDLYFRNVWNYLDVGIYSIFTAYFVLRFFALVHNQHHLNAMAHDLLACNAVLLWPRLLTVLDRYPFFGCLIITMKHMFLDATLFFTMAFVFFIGFYQAFVALAPTGSKTLNPFQILMVMLRIFFGSAYIGFDLAFDFSPYFGPFIMFLYISLTALFLMTILISIFNQSFATVITNASQEHLFNFTTKVLEFVESESLFPFVPPFNLIQIFLVYPLYPFLTDRQFAFLNRTVVRLVFAPFLVAIFLHERNTNSDQLDLDPVLTRSLSMPTSLHSRGRSISERFSNSINTQSLLNPTIKVNSNSHTHPQTHPTKLARLMQGSITGTNLPPLPPLPPPVPSAIGSGPNSGPTTPIIPSKNILFSTTASPNTSLLNMVSNPNLSHAFNSTSKDGAEAQACELTNRINQLEQKLDTIIKLLNKSNTNS